LEIGTDKKALEAELQNSESSTLSVNISKLSPPKKPPSAFFIFQRERKDILKQEEPTLKWPEISKRISQEYKALDDEEKDKYEEQASFLIEAYQAELTP